MSGIYGVLINGRLRAVHNSKKVITIYMKLYNNSNPDDELALIKMKKRAKNKINDFYDMYLEKCMGVYIQSLYVEAYTISNYKTDEIRDNIHKLKQLVSEKQDIPTKELSLLLDLICRLEKAYNKARLTIPQIDTLDKEYWMIEEYRNRIGGY